MNTLKKINELRRTLMRRMTRNIGISRFDRSIDPTTQVEIKRVLICRPNHRLGNLLLITPLLQEVIETLPQTKIDLFLKGGIGPTLFKNYNNINQIIQLPKKPFKNILKYLNGWMTIKKNHYDIVINVVNHSSSGRLSAQLANSTYKFFGDLTPDTQLKYADHKHIAKSPVYSFRDQLNKLGFRKNEKQVASLDLKLSSSEIAAGKKKLNDLVHNQKSTIGLFTYATGAKCYSPSWWEEFYERLKNEYPDYNIIEVLPVENVSQIGFQAPAFYSKDVREIGSLIANTAVFIGADSGMMHLASSVHTPTIGLFKVTNAQTYAPYNNNSLAIDTNTTTMDDWIKILNGVLTKP